ncbi:DUF4158 domain-containing protein [Bacillus mycoides]|uniref:DUF4158 domain-containing protein n=1 Tax=Bacillus mycoides TaxID=1405 RepID=UPI000DE587EB
MQWAERKSRGNVQQLRLLVLIKFVQRLGFFPQFLDIPQTIIHHIEGTIHIHQFKHLDYF